MTVYVIEKKSGVYVAYSKIGSPDDGSKPFDFQACAAVSCAGRPYECFLFTRFGELVNQTSQRMCAEPMLRICNPFVEITQFHNASIFLEVVLHDEGNFV